MAEPLMAKGMGLLAVVGALKSSKRLSARVPAKLQHYLTEPILASSWYPADDHFELLRVLAESMDPKQTPNGNAYVYFGHTTAERDLKGTQEQIPDRMRVTAVGVYRRSLEHASGLVDRIKLTLSLRQRYYSHGAYVVRRTGERTLRIQMINVPQARTVMCAITTGFLEEAFNSKDLDASVRMVSCRAAGQAECVWEVAFKPGFNVTPLAAFEVPGGVTV